MTERERILEWQDINECGHPPAHRVVWLGRQGVMRLGFWVDGPQHENFGTVGGGYIDFANAEGTGPRGLTFAPTHWQDVPGPPPLPKGSIPASEWLPKSNLTY